MTIEIEGLRKYYESEGKVVKAVDNLALTIPTNTIFTLLGSSGCGKTTLLRCIVGLETPDAGEIRIGGEVVYSSTRHIFVAPEKRGLGMVFQTYAIWPHMSVFDNVAYPLQVRHVRRSIIREKVASTLEFVQLAGLESRSATKLSGGQQQRVALARALVAEPKVILFDEPLSNLDAKLREETRKELKSFLTRLEITAIYVTHDRVEALALSDRIAVLRNGKVVEVGSPQEIYFHAKNRYVADFIGRANQIEGTVAERHDGHALVATTIGRFVCDAGDFEEGSKAILCIRPEFVEIADKGEANENVATGRVDTLEFVGEVYEAQILVGTERLLARLDPTAGVREGDTIRVRLEPTHCLLLRPDDA